MDLNADVFEQCSAEYKRQRQGCVPLSLSPSSLRLDVVDLARGPSADSLALPLPLARSPRAILLSHSTSSPRPRLAHRREKQREKQREDKWHALRDTALHNRRQSGSTIPRALLDDDPVPRGTFDPLRDAQDLDDARFDEMDEEMGVGLAQQGGGGGQQGQGAYGGGGGAQAGPSSGGFGGAAAGQPHLGGSAGGDDGYRPGGGGFDGHGDDDAHGDLPPEGQFPDTQRRVVPGAGGGAGGGSAPHVRRKSVIPMDPSILKELQGHKPCVPLSLSLASSTSAPSFS